QILARARRRAADRWCHAGGAVGGQHDARRAGTLRAAADRAEVAWVADLVEAGDERALPRRELVRVGIAVGLAPGEDALVVARPGGVVQVALELDLDARLARLAEPPLGLDGPIARPELEHLAVGSPERLAHRTASVDLLARHSGTMREPLGSSTTSNPCRRISSRSSSARCQSLRARASSRSRRRRSTSIPVPATGGSPRPKSASHSSSRNQNPRERQSWRLVS